VFTVSISSIAQEMAFCVQEQARISRKSIKTIDLFIFQVFSVNVADRQKPQKTETIGIKFVSWGKESSHAGVAPDVRRGEQAARHGLKSGARTVN
jgi:hypothetical protein